MQSLPVVVIGAGVMGMGVAWRLARAGVSVEVYEERTPGAGASRAAAGMLAPHAELEFHELELLAFARASQALWPGFAEELEADAGFSVELNTAGTLLVAVDRDQAELLERQYRHQQEQGLRVEWLSGRQVRKQEELLSPRVVGGVWCPDDHQVSNRQVVAALRAALDRRGVPIHERTPVREILQDAGRVRGVRLADGRDVAADRVVLAAGAWSRGVEGLGVLSPPVRPVKGQMCGLQMDPRAPLLRHVVRTSEVYLVPKADGTLVVGATSEEQGFDDRVTAGGVLELLRAAWETLPGIYELPVRELWTGFRPGCRDNGPLLGATALQGFFLITGHYRNGIQQLPLSVTSVAEVVKGERLPEVCAPFRASRMHEPSPPRAEEETP